MANWTQAQLDQLRAAYASGATRVMIEGVGSTEYRNLDDLAAAIARVERDLGQRPDGSRTTYASFSRG